MSKIIIRESEIEGLKRIPARVSRVLISEHTVGAKKIAMGTTITEPGSKIPIHKHLDSEEAVFVVQGRGKLFCNEEEFYLSPGTAIFLSIGNEHEIINIGDEPLKIVWAYGPPLAEHLE